MTTRLLTWAAYGLVAALALAGALVARARPAVLATLGQVATWAMRRRSTQLGLLLAWWWLGWHFITDR